MRARSRFSRAKARRISIVAMTTDHHSRRPMNSMAGIHRLAVLTATATFFLLFLGGLVTSTGSGLAVPAWPLSFGRFFPPMVGGVLFEHSHRLAATLVGCLTVVLALSVVIRESRPSVRVLA